MDVQKGFFFSSLVSVYKILQEAEFKSKRTQQLFKKKPNLHISRGVSTLNTPWQKSKPTAALRNIDKNFNIISYNKNPILDSYIEPQFSWLGLQISPSGEWNINIPNRGLDYKDLQSIN